MIPGAQYQNGDYSDALGIALEKELPLDDTFTTLLSS